MDRNTLNYVKDLPGFERGHPHYFKDPMIDHLLEIVMLMGGELWAERDHRMIMEHLLEKEGHITATMVEQLEPDEDMAEKLSTARATFTRRVFSCLYDSDDSTGASDFFNVIGKDD